MHKTTVLRYTGTLYELAEELGDLRYDTLATFLQTLSRKMERGRNAENEHGRSKLAEALRTCAVHLADAADESATAWRIAAPFMLSLGELLAKPCPIENAKSGAIYTLVPGTEDAVAPEQDVLQLLHLCNEPHIYDLLFAKRCAGEPYAIADAERFLSWAARGWRDQTHFVYLVRNASGQIGGAIDIKSANRESAEIGYWLSSSHSGVMTNAVQAVAERAREAGYAELFALVRPTNTRSASVLTRAGFTKGEAVSRNDTLYDRWTRFLEPLEGQT